MQNKIQSLIQQITAGRSRNAKYFLALGLIGLLISNLALAVGSEVPDMSSGGVDFKQQPASPAVKEVANWVVASSDNQRMPFAIIDKINAKVFVFDARGQLLGLDSALLGMGRGDQYDVASGSQKMSSINQANRITPAGRFVVSLQQDMHGKEVLLIDYDTAIALHPVVKGTPAERRAERLNSATAQDNRISYGCINVPVEFYQKIISPAFTRTNGIVYILPEAGSAKKVFGFQTTGSNDSK